MNSANSDNKVYITCDMLKDFAAMKRTWFDFWSTKNSDGKMEVVVTDFYAMNLDDIYGVVQRCDISGRTVLEFCMNWFKPLVDKLYSNLCLDDLFGPNPAAISGYRMLKMPETDVDLMMWIIQKMYLIYSDITLENMAKPLSDYLNLREIIQQIEWHTEDMDLPIEERRYIDDIKHDFLMQYDNDLILQESPEEIRELFRMYCDELADNKNLDALRIKGYACYGGNSIYECDWAAAAKCMDVLWREGGFGYAANTLGYIYYYGRLTNGIPDYEKAFYYYSIGNTYGIVESSYKLADMFMNGYYVKQNIDMAASIIEKLYGESRFRFEQGEFDGSFADIALRMGKLQLLRKKTTFSDHKFHAYRLFLQAEFAITMRMLECKQYGDKKVLASIKENLEKTCDCVEHRKATMHVPFPYPVYEFIGAHSYCLYTLKIKDLKKGTKLVITRNPSFADKDYDMTLLTYPEFAICDLTDTVTVIAEDVTYKDEIPAENLVFDTIKTEGDGADKFHKFYFRGECVYTIRAKGFLIKLPNK